MILYHLIVLCFLCFVLFKFFSHFFWDDSEAGGIKTHPESGRREANNKRDIEFYGPARHQKIIISLRPNTAPKFFKIIILVPSVSIVFKCLN